MSGVIGLRNSHCFFGGMDNLRTVPLRCWPRASWRWAAEADVIAGPILDITNGFRGEGGVDRLG